MPFTTVRTRTRCLQLHAICPGSSSQRQQSIQQQTSNTNSSGSCALLLARNVLLSAGQGARELLVSPCSLVAVAALVLYLAPTDAATAADAAQHQQPLYTVAEGGEEFWSNVARYARYFFSVLLGTAYVAVKPLLEAFKRPVTAFTAIAAIVGGAILLKITLNAMLGIDEPFIYEPGNVVPYNP